DSVSDEDRGAAIRPPGEPSPPESAGRPGSPGLIRLTGWLAAAAIAASTLIMIAISVAGPNISVPAMPRPGGGPPWWHPLHLTATVVTVSLWTALVSGCAGCRGAGGGAGRRGRARRAGRGGGGPPPAGAANPGGRVPGRGGAHRAP